MIRHCARLGALFSVVVLGGCNEQPPEPAPSLPPLAKQQLALSSWKAASPDLQDRLLLAHAVVQGKTEAMVMVATEIGSAASVASAIAVLSGDIRVRIDAVGYLRVRLPLDRLADVKALPGVLMAHPDGGGRNGLYENDAERVVYPLANAAADAASDVSHASAVALSEQSTATLLGSNWDAPSVESPTLSTNIEALLQDAADQSVPVLTWLQTGARFPEGGQDLFSLMANRAVEIYGKPMFAAVGETARVAGVSGASSGRRVIAVGEYIDAETFRSRFGVTAPSEQTIPAWSSLGPSVDGGAKPDLLASGSTSAASEAATTLIAAANAEKLPTDARHISWALRMSARPLPDVPAHEQGFGVIDTAKAIELLKRQQARQFQLPDILTRAPVKTFLSRFLPEPGVGQGLYEREGWLAGQKQTRHITLLRQNGPATPLEYSLQWQGNDGTFQTSAHEVALPLNVPVAIEVEIEPKQVGVHSAHLYLIDKSSELPVHAVLATVVASEQFTAANGYTIQHREKQLPALMPTRHFLEVPPNVSSLRVDLAVGAGRLQARLSAGGLAGAGLDVQSSEKIIEAAQPAVMLMANPPPGVYELTLLPVAADAGKRPYRAPADVQVSASIRYVDSQLDEAPGKDNSNTFWMNNIYAPLPRSQVLAEVGASRVFDDVGGHSGMRAYNINVEAGSTSLRVAASPADGRTRVGVYLYDCAAESCRLWGSDAFTKTTAKSLVVPNPRAGLWKVVVDAGEAGTAFKYTEIATHARFGRGNTTDDVESRRIGARWHQKVGFQIAAPAPFGYHLMGVMDLIDLDSAAAERAAPYSDWQQSGDARNQPLRPLRLTTQVMPLTMH